MIDFPRMSRVRTRPTREETREKLFEAAAEVFEEQGIGAASIEAIAAAAGLTRGAFYSNFDDKDELIIAMLEDHVDRSHQAPPRPAGAPSQPADFLAALRTAERSRHDPLGRAPLLHMELILFAARSETPPARARQAPAGAARPGRGDPVPESISPIPRWAAPCCWRWRTASASIA